MKILDSDHCIEFLRGKLNLADFIQPDERLATTTITVGELMYGAHKSDRPGVNIARVNTLLAALDILPFDEQSARRFGQIKAELEKRGIAIGDADMQISGIALHHDATLITHNQCHFRRVTDLKVDDWVK